MSHWTKSQQATAVIVDLTLLRAAFRWEPGSCTPVLTHSVAGGRGGEGRKDGLVRRMVAEENVGRWARSEAEETRRIDDRCRWPTDGQRFRLLVLPVVAAPIAAAAVRWTMTSRLVDSPTPGTQCAPSLGSVHIYVHCSTLLPYNIFITIFNTWIFIGPGGGEKKAEMGSYTPCNALAHKLSL